ncbi:MAG: DegT/DnrJ/EryC1/StrS family aminotransferase [Candidatus Riflebacteria bacterium]|nr:DegT/DnrJ/EryC1/StrS family aminotransferase [Candidatus Riflebacteria bacterium]
MQINNNKIVRLSKSCLSKIEATAVERVILEDGYLGMGSEVDLFEKEISSFLGIERESVVCVNSGTAALHLAIESILPPDSEGSEIVLPSLTFVADFQAVLMANAVPIPCEINPDNLLIDLEDAQKRITEKTIAILPVHYASYPGELEKIYEFAKKNGLRVIEDAAHAFGSYYKNKKIGSIGDVTCFSFDGIKNITSGEGGAIVTSDRQVLQRVKDARLLGIEGDSTKRFAGQRSWDFDVKYRGFRYHMSNIFAALGRAQLSRLNTEFSPKRKLLAGLYRELLKPVKELKFLETDLSQIIPHIQPILILNGMRDSLKEYLLQNSIQTGIHYKPNHLLSLFGNYSVQLPTTEKIYEQILSLPLHPDLLQKDVEMICNTVIDFFTKYSD